MSETGHESEQVANRARLACIVVTYHPDMAMLARQIAALPPDSAIVLVDNASGASIPDQLKALTGDRKQTSVISNGENLGLAAAINLGASEVRKRWSDIEFLLLLDQDSVPQAGSVDLLLEQLRELSHASPPAACVGPNMLDPETGLTHGFHRQTGWRWTRHYPESDTSTPIACSNLNGTGTLVRAELFLSLGGLDEDLFIDHVDTEWSFRVLHAGYGLYGIPNAVFAHHMGESTRRIWLFGWRAWPMRSPGRHYYLFRNAVRLMGRSYVPRVWKTWAVAKLMLTIVIHLLSDPERWTQLREMSRGVRSGLSERSPGRNADLNKGNR